MSKNTLNAIALAISAAAISRPEPYTVKALGNMEVFLKRLPAGVVDDLQTGLMGPNGKIDPSKLKDYRVNAISHALVDENGDRLFEDTSEIRKFDNVVVFELMEVINKRNKIDKEEQEALGNG